MTEAEWLARKSVTEMLHQLGQSLSPRKLRLFACACCRRQWEVLDGPFRHVIEVVEGFADGMCPMAEVDEALENASASFSRALSFSESSWRLSRAARALSECANPLAGLAAQEASRRARAAVITSTNAERMCDETMQEARVQCDILRDISGDPFRPVTFASERRTSTVVALAAQMYETRDFAAMPILANALQDAGCDSDDIVNHCRDPHQAHVRGCWVIDLVLGKT